MKILFICRDIYYFDYPLIAASISEDYGAEIHALTFSTKTASIIEKRYPGVFRSIYNLDGFFNEHQDFQDISLDNKIAALESTEAAIDKSIFQALYLDRTVIKNRYEDLITIAYGAIKFIETLMDEGFDLVVGEIGTFLEYILWGYSRSRNFLYVTPVSARLKGRITMIEGETARVLGLEENYQHYKTSVVGPEEEALFEEFYRDFIGGDKKPDYTIIIPLPIKVKNIIKTYLERKKYKNKSRYVFESIDSSSISQLTYLWIRKLVLKRILDFKNIFSYSMTGKYIYYPLHLNPEISSLLYAPYYVDQMAVIENIAKSIPAGYTLAVKEHPYMYGLRDMSCYRRLRRLPNVRLIHPNANNYNVIQNAEAVVVLTGTAGFEAILFEKPVFILGNVFFDTYDLAYKVNNINNLSRAFSEGISGFRKNKTALKKFTIAYMKSTYAGVCGNSIDNKELLRPENIKNISEAIFKSYSIEKSK